MIRKRFLPMILAGMIMMSTVASDVMVFAEDSGAQSETVSDISDNTSENTETETADSESENSETQDTTATENSSDSINGSVTTEDVEAGDSPEEDTISPVGTLENPIMNAEDLYAAFETASGTEEEPQEIYIQSKVQDSMYVPIVLDKTVGVGDENTAQYIKVIAVDQTIIGRNVTNGESYSGHLFKVNNGSLEFAVTGEGVLKVDGTNASSNTTPSFGSLVAVEGEYSTFIINDNVALTNNYTESHGGAIFNAKGTVILNGGFITGNKITTNSSGQTYGGGILSSGRVVARGKVIVSGNVRTTTQGNLVNDNIAFNAGEKYIDNAYLEIADNLTADNLTEDGKQIGVSVCLETTDLKDYQLVRTENSELDLSANIEGKIKYDLVSKYIEKDGKLSILTEDIQPYGLNSEGIIYKAPTLNEGTSSGTAEIQAPEWLSRTNVILTGHYYCDAPVTIYAVAKEHASGIEDAVSLKELLESSVHAEVNETEHTYTVNLQDLDSNKNYTVFFLAQSEDGALSVTAQFDYSELNVGRPDQNEQTDAEVLNEDETQDLSKITVRFERKDNDNQDVYASIVIRTVSDPSESGDAGEEFNLDENTLDIDLPDGEYEITPNPTTEYIPAVNRFNIKIEDGIIILGEETQDGVEVSETTIIIDYLNLTPTPEPTVTQTPETTATPKPTSTATATPTPKATATPTATPTPIPKRPAVTESTLTGLESAKKFYPKVLYPFTVKGAGTDNNSPNEGDWKWYPFYWTTKSSDIPDDDYDSEASTQNWKIGNKNGIKEEKTFNLYVWFRRYIYTNGEWVRDTRYDNQYKGKQRAIYQFRSAAVDDKTFDDALSGTPVPDSEISDGGIRSDDLESGDSSSTSSKDKANNAKTGDETPIGTMLTLIVAALAIFCGIFVLKRRKNPKN